MSQNFDFEKAIDRKESDSVKWNRFKDKDILPLWIADMDFSAPPTVLEALKNRVDHGCLGYGEAWPALTDAVVRYLDKRYEWKIDSEWIVWLPGLVVGINVACRSSQGDVVTATPVYPPFLSAPHLSGYSLTKAALKLDDNYWSWDFEALEKAITDKTKLFLLCHPHNPVGRMWEEDELKEIARICEKHDLIVCSDEIHCDLILEKGKKHQPLASLNREIAERSITLMAPSKTYNIPGLGCSFAIIPNPVIRKRFTDVMRGIVPDVNVLGFHAALAAYTHSEGWHQALIEKLRTNRDLVEKTINSIPQLGMTHIEATYLAWIDVRKLKLENPVAFFEKAGVGLSDGADFGTPGWVRLNFGCTEKTLKEALARIEKACASLT